MCSFSVGTSSTVVAELCLVVGSPGFRATWYRRQAELGCRSSLRPHVVGHGAVRPRPGGTDHVSGLAVTGQTLKGSRTRPSSGPAHAAVSACSRARMCPSRRP